MKRETIEGLANHFILPEAQKDLRSTRFKNCRSMEDHWLNLRLCSIVPISKQIKLRDKMTRAITDIPTFIDNLVSFALNNPIERVVTLAFVTNWLVKKKMWNRFDRARLYRFKCYLLNALIFRFYWEDKIILAADVKGKQKEKHSLPKTNWLIVDYDSTDPPDLILGFLRVIQPTFDDRNQLDLIRKTDSSIINTHLPCNRLAKETSRIVAKVLKKSELEPVLPPMLLPC